MTRHYARPTLAQGRFNRTRDVKHSDCPAGGIWLCHYGSESLQPTSTSMSVTVTVPATCLVSPSPLTLGTYIAERWSAESNASVKCNYPAAYTLGIVRSGEGNGISSCSAGTPFQWAMQTHAFGSSPRLNDATVDPSQLPRRFVPTLPSIDSIIIVVTY